MDCCRHIADDLVHAKEESESEGMTVLRTFGSSAVWEDALSDLVFVRCSQSIRTMRVLDGMGVATVDGLCRFSEADLLCQRNCGRKTVNELKAGLAFIGRHLSLTNSWVSPLPPPVITVFRTFGADFYPPA